MSAKKKMIRQKFRDSVLKRDRDKCVICKNTENINVHHITDRSLMPAGGYVKENGIALCQEHFTVAEMYHQSDGETYEEGFHPKQLYNKIGSSYEKALESSKKLERYEQK